MAWALTWDGVGNQALDVRRLDFYTVLNNLNQLGPPYQITLSSTFPSHTTKENRRRQLEEIGSFSINAHPFTLLLPHSLPSNLMLWVASEIVSQPPSPPPPNFSPERPKQFPHPFLPFSKPLYWARVMEIDLWLSFFWPRGGRFPQRSLSHSFPSWSGRRPVQAVLKQYYFILNGFTHRLVNQRGGRGGNSISVSASRESRLNEHWIEKRKQSRLWFFASFFAPSSIIDDTNPTPEKPQLNYVGWRGHLQGKWYTRVVNMAWARWWRFKSVTMMTNSSALETGSLEGQFWPNLGRPQGVANFRKMKQFCLMHFFRYV